MRATTIKITLSCSLLAMAVIAWTQARRPGLWEMTTTTTWQQSPLPEGMSGGGEDSPFAGGANTVQVCLTQSQIEEYGAIVPQTRNGTCEVVNVVKKTNSTTAEMICSGTMSGKGSLESSWEDDQHAKGKVHFIGSVQAGPDARPIEWTSEATSTFKGSGCGNVKPFAMLESK